MVDAQPIQVVAILIGYQYDAFVADGHLDGIHLIGGEYGVLGDINHADRDGKLALVGLVEGQREPEDAGEAQEEQKDQKILIRIAEYEVADNLPPLFDAHPYTLYILSGAYFCMGVLATSLNT